MQFTGMRLNFIIKDIKDFRLLSMNVYKQTWFWLLLTIVIFLINQLPFITDIRPVMYDEAWYANTAYHFSQGEGFLNSVVGASGNSNFLLPLLTGTMFRVFGCSLFTVRLMAVLCGVVTLLFLHLCLQELKCSVKAEILVLAFFVSIPLYNTIFRFGRPECASLMCMTGGIWILLRYVREANWQNMIGLAFFTYFATVGHPYALLFFALVGVALLIKTITEKSWVNLWHLAILLLSSILAIVSLLYISRLYDIAGGPSVLSRFSMSNILNALPLYLKECFASKTTLYMLIVFPAIGWSCLVKEWEQKSLAFISITYFVLFPFLFSTDLNMIGLGLEYVVLVGTILMAPCVDKLLKCRYRCQFITIFALYCVLNIGLSYYYNYHVKYEKCNSILETEISAIIPQDALVYTPLRQYPMVMANKCYSDHYVGDLPIVFDYIILNSQDEDKYENSIEIKTYLDQYVMIYEKSTKQYGVVKVYKYNEQQKI